METPEPTGRATGHETAISADELSLRADLVRRLVEQAAAAGTTADELLASLLDQHNTSDDRDSRVEELSHFFALPTGLLCIVSEDGRFRYVNPSFERTLGYKEAELTGTAVLDLVHPDDVEYAATSLQRLLKGDILNEILVRFRHRSGKYAWLSWSAFREKSNGLLYGVARDVTHRTVVELELQHHAQRLEILRELDRAIVAETAPSSIVEVALPQVRQLVPYLRASVVRFNDSRTRAEIIAAYGPDGRIAANEELSIPDPADLHPLTLNRVIHLDDPASASCVLDRDMLVEPIRAVLALPLLAQARLTGALYVGLSSSEPLDTDVNEFMRDVADLLAIAIHQAELLAAEREQRQVAESLIQVAAELHSLHDMDAVLERIMHYTMRVIPTFRTASIMLVENEDILRVHRFSTGGTNTQVPVNNVTIPMRDIPNLKHIVTTGQPIVIDDTRRSETWLSRRDDDWTRAYVGVPIRASSDVVGMINLRSDMPGAFTAAHVSQLQAFADHAGVVIHNIRLYDAVLQSIGELTALYRATSLLFTADNLTELGAQVAQAVVDEFQQVDCGVILIDPDDPDSKRLIRLERRGEMRRRVQRDLTLDGSGMVPAAIRSGETLYAPDVAGDPNYLESDPSTRAELVVPLPTSQGVIGVLDLQSTAVDAFSERDRRVIKAFAERAAAALDKMFLIEEIRRHAADLEERVNARARELRATTERIEGIFNSTSDAIVVTDADGVIRQTNLAFTRMFGYSPEEITGRPLTLLVMPVDRPLLNMQPSEPRSTRTRTHPQRIELSARRRDGATFVADVAVSTVVRDERSELIYSIRDITDRKEAETGLRRTRDQLQAILDNTTVSIYVKDSHSRYILANRQCEELAARAGTKFLGNSDFDVFTEDVAVAVRANDQIVLDSGQSHQFEESIRYNAEDPPHVFLSMKVPLFDEMGRAYAVCGISTDITAQKQLEQELRETLRVERELGELKSRFVAMVSHEFRTPLTTILSSSELLRLFSDRMDDDRKMTHLKKIQSQVHHLTDMLDSILTLNRGEVVGLRFDPAEIDMDDFCAMTIEEVMLSARPGQHIVADNQPRGAHIHIDERLLRVVLTNLLTNAFKYSPENSAITLNMRVEPGLLIIDVTDEGIGIPEDDLKHLFTAFHRAANVGVTPGTGLGLSILKQNIDAYGGTIHVASTLGQGTTFTVNLPLNDPHTSGA